ncbi:MAG: O-antigen ligase family protein [Actinomycetota bacterium]|nr:O-antigen ligase family protein [Actinomycetota bacterium]
MWLGRLPSQNCGATARWLWGATLASLVAGLLAWALGAGVVALWCFTGAAVAIAVVLPYPWAFVSPLYMGLAGWLVDMLPFVILAGWAAVVLRWGVALVRARRWPGGGRWTLLPAGLVVWTMLGALVISAADARHFALLLAVQGLASGILLAAVDTLAHLDDRSKVVAGLVAYVVVLTVAVIAVWAGLPLEDLQDKATARLVERAYGVDAFENNIGMIKDEKSSRGGGLELKREIDRLAERDPRLPAFEVFQPRFRAFPKRLIVRFQGSARPWQDQLEQLNIELLYDNIGFGAADTVARMRSFPRNANTYAGIGAVLLPFAFYLAWTGRRRVGRLGWTGVAGCLFGIGFSLTRGAWLAAAAGIVVILIAGRLARPLKVQMGGAFVVGAVVLSAFYLVKYNVDPYNARAEGGGSVNTRSQLYGDTIRSVDGLNILLGYGTEKPRTSSGVSHALGRYIPRAGTHSTYLNYLFRAGVPGALMITAIYVIAGLHALAAARSQNGPDGLFGNAALAGVVAAAAHAVVQNLYVEPIYTLTICLVLGLAMAGRLASGVPVVPGRRHPPLGFSRSTSPG